MRVDFGWRAFLFRYIKRNELNLISSVAAAQIPSLCGGIKLYIGSSELYITPI